MGFRGGFQRALQTRRLGAWITDRGMEKIGKFTGERSIKKGERIKRETVT